MALECIIKKSHLQNLHCHYFNFIVLLFLVTPVWVGVKYSGGTFTWLDGTEVPRDHPLYTQVIQQQGYQSQDLCATLNPYGRINCTHVSKYTTTNLQPRCS